MAVGSLKGSRIQAGPQAVSCQPCAKEIFTVSLKTRIEFSTKQQITSKGSFSL